MMRRRPPSLANLARALDRGNLMVIRGIAAQLDHIPLREALRITELIAEQVPDTYERAALRWLERYCAEAAETVSELIDVASDLDALGTGDRAARERLRARVGA